MVTVVHTMYCSAVTWGFYFTQYYCWTRGRVRWIGYKSKVSIQKRKSVMFLLVVRTPFSPSFYLKDFLVCLDKSNVLNVAFYICNNDSQWLLDFHVINRVVTLWTLILFHSFCLYCVVALFNLIHVMKLFWNFPN